MSNISTTFLFSSSSSTYLSPSSSTTINQQSLFEIQLSLIVYCYILPIICIIGLIGNIINLIILYSLSKLFQYLKALAISDIFCMLFVLIFVLIEIVKQFNIINLNHSIIIVYYQTYFMLSLINWSLSVSVYIVVLLSIERFISILFPIKYRNYNNNYSYIYVISIYLFAGIFYIPYALLRYTIKYNYINHNNKTIVIYSTEDSDISKTFKWQVCFHFISLKLINIIKKLL